MFNNLKIFDENEPLFNSLCDSLKKGPCISDLMYDCTNDQRGDSPKRENIKKRAKLELNLEEIAPNLSDVYTSTDTDSECRAENPPQTLKETQCKFLESLQSGLDISTICDFDYNDIIAEKSLILNNEEIFQHVDKISLSMGPHAVYIFAKLVILPKAYHEKKLNLEFMKSTLHTLKNLDELSIIQGLVCPLLSLGYSDGNYVELLFCLYEDEDMMPSSRAIIELYRSLAQLEDVNENHLSILEFLLSYADAENSDEQESAMNVFEKYSSMFLDSVEFGRLLLDFIRVYGRNLVTFEILNFVVMSHKSGLKRAIEMEYKRAIKERN